MSLAVDIRYLTIPFTLLIAKIGLSNGKNKGEQKNSKNSKESKASKKGGCGCNLMRGGAAADISMHGFELINTIHSLKDA
jgi:hypothetical protein